MLSNAHYYYIIGVRSLEAELISLENLNENTGITSVHEIIKHVGQSEMKNMLPMVLTMIKY